MSDDKVTFLRSKPLRKTGRVRALMVTVSEAHFERYMGLIDHLKSIGIYDVSKNSLFEDGVDLLCERHGLLPPPATVSPLTDNGE